MIDLSCSLPRISRNATNASIPFIEASRSVWFSMRAAHGVNFTISEETITENLLFFIKYAFRFIRVRYDFHVETFSKREEAKIGADWEWYFIDGSRKYIPMRIQAKRIFLNGECGSYNSLLHKTGKSKIPQIDVLINNSSANGYYPAYMFYNTNVDGSCPLVSQLTHDYGCSFAPARLIHDIASSGSLNCCNYQNAMVPLREIMDFGINRTLSAASENDPGPDLTGRILEAFTRKFPDADKPAIRTDLPAYVERAIDKRSKRRLDKGAGETPLSGEGCDGFIVLEQLESS